MGEIIKKKSYLERVDVLKNEPLVNVTNKVLLGFHASGKTTFLAALWHLLNYDFSPTAPFKLINLESYDTKYLNEIKKRWIKFKEVYHTGMYERHNIEIYLQNRNSHRKHTLSFLDISGDIFQKCWSERYWDKDFDRYVQIADSVILFINPINQIYPNTINEVYEVFHEVFLEPHDYSFDIDTFFEDMAIPFDVTPWDADDAPSQVKLIELLQIVLQRCLPGCKLTVVVSAWDTIQFNNISPELWVGRRLPLLMQYLIANFSYGKNLTVFGLSAQGAPYHSKTEKERAKQKLANLDAIDRIIVSKSKNEPGTMFDILKWICDE